MQLKTTQRETGTQLPAARAAIEARELERIYGRTEKTMIEGSGSVAAGEGLERLRAIVRRLEVLAEEDKALDELDILAQAEEANAMDPVG